MSAKKRTKTTNILAQIYEGNFELSFDCMGVDVCRFALCEIMPPTPTAECCYREHGSCICPQSQSVALGALLNKIKKEIGRRDEVGA
jgi:hypothetical protein